MRVTQPPAVGLIATHAAVSAAVHGVTGTLVGTSDSQTLTNKILSTTSITVINAGVGADPILSSNSSGRVLSISDYLVASGNLGSNSGTAFIGYLDHAISANRTWTLPDVAGNVLIDVAEQDPHFASITIANALAGADPIFTSSHSSDQRLLLAGSFTSSGNIRADQNFPYKSGTAYEGAIQHTISEARVWTLPDVSGNVLIDVAEQSPHFTDVTIKNVGAGADPILSSDATPQQLDLAGSLWSTNSLYADINLIFKSSTAYLGTLTHSNTVNRAYEFPDVGGNVLIDVAEQAPKFDHIKLKDGIDAPGATVGSAKIYVDTLDGDLKIIFGDGVIKTLSADS